MVFNTYLIPLAGRFHVLVVVLDAGEDTDVAELLGGNTDGGADPHRPRLNLHPGHDRVPGRVKYYEWTGYNIGRISDKILNLIPCI